MVVFGAEEALGLVSLIVLVSGAAAIARTLVKRGGASRGASRVDLKLADFEEREEINRLRHRDFEAFLTKLNARRERLGQAALTREYLLPHQFDLMYSVDAGDVDEAQLEKLRKRALKAAKVGDEVAVVVGPKID